MSRWRGTWSRMDFGEKYSFVVYERWGKKFQIVVDTNEAIKYKMGQEVMIDDVIIHPYVFSDINKGELSPTEDLRKMLYEVAIDKLEKKLGRSLKDDEKKKIMDEIEDWDDEKVHHEAAKIILEKGFLKLPEQVRNRLIEEKMNKMLRYIQKYAINPATNAPYPPMKLAEAFKKALGKGVNIDPFMDIKDIIPIVIKYLKDVIPIRLEIIIARLRVPPAYTGQLYGKILQYATMCNQKWLEDGTLEAELEIPAGMFLKLSNMLTETTRGLVKLEIISRKTIE